MVLALAAYRGGVLTSLSPRIVPVLPFVFARTGQPFARRGVPILLGIGITFAEVASFAKVGGGSVVATSH